MFSANVGAAEGRAKDTSIPLVRTRKISRASARQLDDQSLLAWVIDGDENGTRTLLERFRGLIVRMARRTAERSGVRLGEDELKDIAAQVSMNLIANDRRRLRLYDPTRGASVSTWLGLITSSTTKDYLRSARRRPFTPVATEELDSRSAPGLDPEAQLAERELAALASAAVETLSARDREFVSLYFGEALEPEEVAARLGVSVGTVYSKKAKITAKLGEALAAA